MRRAFLRGLAVMFISVLLLMLFVSYPSLHYSSSPDVDHHDNSATPTEVRRLGEQSPQVEQSGMEAVQNLPLKYPWDTTLLSPRQISNRSEEAIRAQLLPGMIPPNVHYFWCGLDRWLEFKHYLSILSIVRLLPIDKLVFHYQHKPVRDKMYYNLWYSDLKHDLPFFEEQPMLPWQLEYCEGEGQQRLGVVLKTLDAEGGLYISENTWMLGFSSEKRLVDLEISYDTDSDEGFVLLRQGVWQQHNMSVDSFLHAPPAGLHIVRSQCSHVHHVFSAGELGQCTIVKGGIFERIWPMNIWDLDNAFGRLARKTFYGSEEIRQPQPSYDSLVPNIGHMVWIGGGPMDFVFYLSVLSMMYVAEVETVFIHGDKEPSGEYWQQLRTGPDTSARLVFVYRAPPYQIYQGVIEEWYRALMSDIIRVDLMIKYGGIYTDTDAIWAKPLTLEDRAYDAVASFDWVDWSWPYPDSVNFGISYGKKNAPFWQIFRESMRRLHNEHHGFTGVMMPYKLLEKYPHLLRIDRHLQVICYYSKCHPIWDPDYHNMTRDHTNTGSLDHWQRDVNALHWTYPNPPEYANMTTLLQGSGLFADLGKMVLRKAGKLS